MTQLPRRTFIGSATGMLLMNPLVHAAVLEPLGMQDSAWGTGTLMPDQLVECQVEFRAVETGASSAEHKDWDWNSSFWRQLWVPLCFASGSK